MAVPLVVGLSLALGAGESESGSPPQPLLPAEALGVHQPPRTSARPPSNPIHPPLLLPVAPTLSRGGEGWAQPFCSHVHSAGPPTPHPQASEGPWPQAQLWRLAAADSCGNRASRAGWPGPALGHCPPPGHRGQPALGRMRRWREAGGTWRTGDGVGSKICLHPHPTSLRTPPQSTPPPADQTGDISCLGSEFGVPLSHGGTAGGERAHQSSAKCTERGTRATV